MSKNTLFWQKNSHFFSLKFYNFWSKISIFYDFTFNRFKLEIGSRVFLYPNGCFLRHPGNRKDNNEQKYPKNAPIFDHHFYTKFWPSILHILTIIFTSIPLMISLTHFLTSPNSSLFHHFLTFDHFLLIFDHQFYSLFRKFISVWPSKNILFPTLKITKIHFFTKNH